MKKTNCPCKPPVRPRVELSDRTRLVPIPGLKAPVGPAEACFPTFREDNQGSRRSPAKRVRWEKEEQRSKRFSPLAAEMSDTELATTQSRIKGWRRNRRFRRHICPQCGRPIRVKSRTFCPARKLGFRRWGKHSAWLSAPHFAAPGGGFAGRSPHPLPRRKVRFARNALREWAFLAPLPCSSFSNGTRFAGLPFERKPEKKRRLAQRKKTENGT